MGRDLRIKAQELALEIVKHAPLEYQFGDPAEDAIAYVRALEAASCCDYRDHSPGPCTCPDHERSAMHPLGVDAP